MNFYTLISKNNFKGKYGEIAQGIIIEKQSKFLSFLFKIDNENQAQEKIELIKKDNLQARHVVYIYSVLNNNVTNIRFSDDGEPKGTGTKAIYELIEKEKITNICIIIVRYFGGILLGAGPLSRTYLNAARICIELCQKKEIYNYINYEFKCSYSVYNILKSKLEEFESKEQIITIESIFDEKVLLKLKIVDFKFENIVKVIEEVNYDK